MPDLQVFSPFSGESVCRVPFDTGRQVQEKVARCRAAQRAWARCPVGERARRVAEALGWFRERAEAVARDIALQMGKPVAQGRREVAGMLERAEHMVAIAEESLRPDVLEDTSSGGVRRRIEHAPLGVVLDVAAWNYPLLIAVNVVVPALLAGNGVLLKHSARTPLCGAHFARAFAGLGEGLVCDLVLSHGDSAQLIAGRRVDYVAFTGSVEGGRRVYSEAGAALLDAGMELGGKDPAYVAEDADLETAVAGVVDGACYNAGQSCCAVERVYVHRSRYPEFLERAAAVLSEYRLGDPLDENTTIGPLASADAPAFLAAQVQDAVARGARVLHGGSARERQFFEPTLLADCPQDCEVMREESFGPLVPVCAVDDDDEALARMNDSRFGLTASVWTASGERGERFARELEAGTVYQNGCDFLDPALPWTGWKDSGFGSTLSRYGFLHLTQRKAVFLRPQ